MHIQLLDAQYTEKTSQLPSYVFSTVPSILPIQQPTLSSSGLPTDMSMIKPNTAPSRDPTQSPSKKPYKLSSFYQVKTPAGNHHRSLVKRSLYWKS